MLKTSICFIERIPLEILEEILSQSFPTALPLSSSHRSLIIQKDGKVSCPTLVLSQVSSTFRSLILQRPPLWSSIEISLSEMIPNHLELLSAYISRSRNAPLDIVVHLPKERNASNPLIEAATCILLSQHSRWCRFEYKHDVDSFHPRWLGRRVPQTLDADPFPNLTVLKMCSVEDAMLFRSISRAKLQVLQVRLLHWVDFRSSNIFELPNLTEFRIYMFEGFPIREILQRLPSLQKLVLGLHNGGEYTGSPPERNLVTSNISTLCVSRDGLGHGSFTESEVWGLLRLPRLEVLELGNPLVPYHPEPNDLDYTGVVFHFGLKLISSGCVLRKVKLDRLSAQDMIDMISSCSSVSDLTISLRYGDACFHDLLSQMTICPGDSHHSLPSLCSLSILLEEPRRVPTSRRVEFVCESLCDMVESRILQSVGGVAQLKIFSMDSKTRAGVLGQSICSRLSDTITVLAKDEVDFRLEDPLQ